MIIGVTGRAQAGKSTVSAMAIKLLKEQGVPATSIACADPIREIVFDLFGTAFELPRAIFYEDELKGKDVPGLPNWTPRKLYQYVGKAMRTIHPDVYAKFMINKAHELLAGGYQHVFISDLRFPEEANLVHRAGGLVIRVKRPEADVAETVGFADDESERALETICDDYVIDNGGAELYKLEELVIGFLKQIKAF